MTVRLSTTVSPGEKRGLTYDFAPRIQEGDSLATATVSVTHLHGADAIEATDPVVDSATGKADVTLTIPAGSSGHRWEVTVHGATSQNAIYSLSAEVVVV